MLDHRRRHLTECAPKVCGDPREPDLRDEYGALKLALAADPTMDIDTYIARKSPVLQKALALAGLTDDERRRILLLNTPWA